MYAILHSLNLIFLSPDPSPVLVFVPLVPTPTSLRRHLHRKRSHRPLQLDASVVDPRRLRHCQCLFAFASLGSPSIFPSVLLLFSQDDPLVLATDSTAFKNGSRWQFSLFAQSVGVSAKAFTVFSTNVEEDAFSLPLPNIDVGSSAPHEAPIGELNVYSGYLLTQMALHWCLPPRLTDSGTQLFNISLHVNSSGVPSAGRPSPPTPKVNDDLF
ncbi:hypothetical protein F5888DRAFT_1874195 [Russula emetica]|nr:hypothetical protein F5888DRAFT_1874195 [Russula emetica]